MMFMDSRVNGVQIPIEYFSVKKFTISKEVSTSSMMDYELGIPFAELMRAYGEIIHKSYRSYAAADWQFAHRRDDHIAMLCQLNWPPLMTLIHQYQPLFIEWLHKSFAYPLLVELLRRDQVDNKNQYIITRIDSVSLEKETLVFRGKAIRAS